MDNIKVSAHDERGMFGEGADDFGNFFKGSNRIIVANWIRTPETVMINYSEAIFECSDLDIEIVAYGLPQNNVVAILVIDKLATSRSKRISAKDEIPFLKSASRDIAAPVRREEDMFKAGGFNDL